MLSFHSAIFVYTTNIWKLQIFYNQYAKMLGPSPHRAFIEPLDHDFRHNFTFFCLCPRLDY